MVKKDADVIDVLRRIIYKLDQKELGLAAIYIEKAIEIIKKSGVKMDKSEDFHGK